MLFGNQGGSPPGDERSHRALAVFDDTGQARIAREHLVSEGLAPADVELIGHGDAPDVRAPREGLLSLGLPAAEARECARALKRGCALLAVRHPRRFHARVVEVLESFELVDLSEDVDGGLAAGGGDEAGAQVIRVVEERLVLAKRRVAEGRVRVRAYAIERPAEARVLLREESISVERRAVDRLVPPGEVPDGAFRDRVLEVRARGEEAVAAKGARVVEEISIRREGHEHTETVRALLRRDAVEIQPLGR